MPARPAPQTAPTTLSVAIRRAPWRFLGTRWPALALSYAISSAVVGVLLIAATVAFFLLLPLTGIALGHVERRRIALLGWPRPASPHVRLRRRDPGARWLRTRLREPGTWREFVTVFLAIVFGAAIVVALAATALALGVAVVVCVAFVVNPENMPVTLFGTTYTDFTIPGIAVTGVLALLACILMLYVFALLALAQAALTRMLLSAREEELARQVRRLQRSRLSLVDAFEGERRRIERELHDGVQQRLVALSMQLGLAELELGVGDAPPAARDAVARAHAHAEEALVELRNTVRGIHPQVLADHGLAAAVGEIAERSPIPVAVDLPLERLPSPVEAAAYFTIAEALGNALRHSAATRIGVRSSLTEATLAVEIRDNGTGGAHPRTGGGIDGLRQRAEALGGELRVASPIGGPTVLELVLPRILDDGMDTGR